MVDGEIDKEDLSACLCRLVADDFTAPVATAIPSAADRATVSLTFCPKNIAPARTLCRPMPRPAKGGAGGHPGPVVGTTGGGSLVL
jgi:hypothetical protein